MSDRALTPDSALGHLKDLSRDVRAAVLLDARGRVVASEGEPEDPERMAELAAELLERAAEAAGDVPPSQVEVSVAGGVVYVVSERNWTLAAVAGRGALSSLMFYDLRSVLSLLEERRAA